MSLLISENEIKKLQRYLLILTDYDIHVYAILLLLLNLTVLKRLEYFIL